MTYGTDLLYEEVSYIAYHLHWPLDTLLDLEHLDRVRMIRAVGSLNDRAWEAVREHA